MVAIKCGQVDMLRVLTNRDVSAVTKRDAKGKFPVTAAVYQNSVEMVQILLDCGVDVECEYVRVVWSRRCSIFSYVYGFREGRIEESWVQLRGLRFFGSLLATFSCIWNSKLDNLITHFVEIHISSPEARRTLIFFGYRTP